MKHYYIQAVLEMLEDGKKLPAVLTGLTRTLAKKGHSRIHGAVLRGILRAISAQRSATETTVVVAHSKHLTANKRAIEEAITLLNAHAEYNLVIDESIIGGSIVRTKDRLIDNSYKSRLVRLYRSVTK